MEKEIPENKISIHVELDRSKVTPELIKQITDQIVADLAQSRTREVSGGHTKSDHYSGHWK